MEVEVTLLSCADRMATRGQGQDDWIAAHLELAPRSWTRRCGGARPARRPCRSAATSWRVSWASRPGPSWARLLAELEAAVYAGEVADRDQAVDYARRMLDNR